MSTTEQQIANAREAGRAEAQHSLSREQASNLLHVALSARGKTGDDLAELVAAANPAAFIVDGRVDPAKVNAYATRLTGSGGPGGSGGGTKSVAVGRDLHRARTLTTRPNEAR